MTQDEKVAYIHAQTACALAEIEGMKAENAERERRGESLAWNYDSFLKIPTGYGITHNQVIDFFRS